MFTTMLFLAACAFLFSSLSLVTACSPEPLDFPDWTIPVPEGTPVIEYASVPMEERTERIELVEDLVIGGDTEDSNYAFYRASDIEVAADGRIFVHDTGNHRVQVFDGNGAYIRTIGREGSGPGEISRGGRLAIAAGRLARSGDSRLSVWTLEGEHLGDSQVTFARSLSRPFGLPDGSLVASYQMFNDDQTTQVHIVRISAEAEEIYEYADLRNEAGILTLMTETGPVIVERPGASPAFAASSSGRVYITLGDEYQVLALMAAGEPRWALRVAWTRSPLTTQDKEAAVVRRLPDTVVDRLDVDWPELNAALSRNSLSVDGHGNLYVFPRVPHTWEREERPVDVYSPDGELLFAGMMPDFRWMAALDDYVYVIETDPDTEEQVVVRYRIVEPF